MHWRFCLVLLLLLPALSVRAQNVVADISERKVDVTVGYSGTKLLVFGAMKRPADIAVVVEGPPVRAKLWTKKREWGIWINGHPRTFAKVPGYYAVATTRAITETVKPKIISRYGLNLISLKPPQQPEESVIDQDDFNNLKLAEGRRRHYQEKQTRVETLQKSLFRVDFDIPASAPKGNYKVRVHMIDGGRVVSTETVPLTVETVGLEASIYRLAHKQPFLYAFLALAASLGLGGVAAYLFRRLA